MPGGQKKKMLCCGLLGGISTQPDTMDIWKEWKKMLVNACMKVRKDLATDMIFLNCYLTAPWPILVHYGGGSLTHPVFITAFLNPQPKGHSESRIEVGSLSPAEHLVGFES